MNTFPLTYKLIVSSLFPKGKLKVLDLGCGKGAAGEIFNQDKTHDFIGIDLFAPYVKECKNSGYYSKAIKKDITKYKAKEDFDLVLILQVLEHLKKADSKRLIKNITKSTKARIIVSIPNGDCDQGEYEGNPYQKHLSTWTPKDLEKLGFKVYGQGLGIVYGEKSYAVENKIQLWQKLAAPLSILLSPFIFFNPKYAAQLIAVKY